MTNKNKTPLFSIIIILLILPVFVSCKKKEATVVVEKKINVRIEPSQAMSIRPFIDSIGALNPYETVTVSAEIDGILKQVNVSEGSPASKGMILAVVDDTDYGLEVKKAEAALRQSEATRENTKLEFGRKHALLKEELVTRQQFDDVATRLSLAEADVERAKLSLSLAKQKLTKTKIYSPMSGMIKEKKAAQGDYARNGMPLFTIIQNNPLKLNFTVPEKEIGRLRKGQEVNFTVDSFPGREFKGRITVIYPTLDEKTRTLQSEAQVQNNDGLLKPGLFAKAILYTEAAREGIVIPVTSLLYEGEKTKVFVVEGDIAKERQVKIGNKYGEFMEIIEGIKKGEQVVVVGQQNLSDGVKVNVAR
jgi:membrane fusion protein (multidrug efflux system)